MSDSYAAVWRTHWKGIYHFGVAMVLARYQDREGYCGLKQKTIGRLAYCSPRHVANVLQDMREGGQIEVIEQKRADGSQGPNRIRLTLQAVVDSRTDPIVTADDFYPDLRAIPARRDGGSRIPSGTGDEPDAVGVMHGVQTNSKRVFVSESQENKDGAIAPGPNSEIQQAYDAYNAAAAILELSIATKLTDSRKKHLAKRLAENDGLAGWMRMLEMLAKSKFLRGMTKPRDGGEPFRADLDFCLQAKSFQKIVEGGYGEDAKPPGGAIGETNTVCARLLADPAMLARQVSRWDQDPDTWPIEAGPAPGEPGSVCTHDVAIRYSTRLRLASERAQRAPTTPTMDDEAAALM